MVGGRHTQISVPGTFANDASSGTNVWTIRNGTAQTANFVDELEQVQTADSIANVGFSVSDNGVESNRLKLTNFSFDIPKGSRIDGILAEIYISISQDDDSYAFQDYEVKLLKNNSVIGNNKAQNQSTTRDTAGSATSDSLGLYRYGGTSDTWGTPWTVDDINNLNFGISLMLEAQSGNRATLLVVQVYLGVVFTPPSGFLVAGEI